MKLFTIFPEVGVKLFWDTTAQRRDGNQIQAILFSFWGTQLSHFHFPIIFPHLFLSMRKNYSGRGGNGTLAQCLGIDGPKCPWKEPKELDLDSHGISGDDLGWIFWLGFDSGRLDTLTLAEASNSFLQLEFQDWNAVNPTGKNHHWIRVGG